MTGKEHLRKKVGRIMGSVSMLSTAAVISLILAQLLKGGEAVNFLFLILVAPLIIAVMAALVFITFFVRCQECKKPIGLHFVVSGITAKRTSNGQSNWGTNNCPHCGTDLNKDMKEK